MLIVNSRKPVYRLKKKVSESFSPEYFLPFSFQWKFFPKHATRENGLKGLVRSRVVDQNTEYSCIAIGGYGPAGSFQIWYDATTPHHEENHRGWSSDEDETFVSWTTEPRRPNQRIMFRTLRDFTLSEITKEVFTLLTVFFPLKTFSEHKNSTQN